MNDFAFANMVYTQDHYFFMPHRLLKCRIPYLWEKTNLNKKIGNVIICGLVKVGVIIFFWNMWENIKVCGRLWLKCKHNSDLPCYSIIQVFLIEKSIITMNSTLKIFNCAIGESCMGVSPCFSESNKICTGFKSERYAFDYSQWISLSSK